MKLYREIFTTFTKIGALTFGGGYAMLPIMHREAVERRGWLTKEEVADYYALSQSLPGVIMINVAAFVGHKLAGTRGSTVACLGVVVPSFVLITFIAAFIQGFLGQELVQRAFFGIRVVVCALIVQAIIKLWKSSVKDTFGIVVYIVTLALVLLVGVPIIAVVACAILAGIAHSALRRRVEAER
ncbi:MAG: chromate transporter [Oscillospiraceae bacterium]|nr:chromate transporter [Oscillospiraceae bacterium]